MTHHLPSLVRSDQILYARVLPSSQPFPTNLAVTRLLGGLGMVCGVPFLVRDCHVVDD
jgi:hypothetical protein